MELETSRIMKIRADPLTIPEEEMGFRGHWLVDLYTEKFSVLVPPDFTTINETKSQETTHGGSLAIKCGAIDSGFVEEKVRGAVGLSPHRADMGKLWPVGRFYPARG
ncbi:hypothetical protein AVEN_221349-1 [Araneus ventricosus]|uniref:Uncharacterized protein n=1 Tax=Araneus ventricosus TaxID=182803 RepID=A0A4Y2AZD3_ARAVE|nr:hypothetical protein AVEN_221349-1 [Araneus ventricosus]